MIRDDQTRTEVPFDTNRSLIFTAKTTRFPCLLRHLFPGKEHGVRRKNAGRDASKGERGVQWASLNLVKNLMVIYYEAKQLEITETKNTLK